MQPAERNPLTPFEFVATFKGWVTSCRAAGASRRVLLSVLPIPATAVASMTLGARKG